MHTKISSSSVALMLALAVHMAVVALLEAFTVRLLPHTANLVWPAIGGAVWLCLAIIQFRRPGSWTSVVIAVSALWLASALLLASMSRKPLFPGATTPYSYTLRLWAVGIAIPCALISLNLRLRRSTRKPAQP